MFVQFILNGLVSGSLIALTAIGFSLIYNTMRVFHIAYAGIYVWAGYMLFVLSAGAGFPLLLSLLLSILAAAVLSAVCGIFIYVPLTRRGRSNDSLMVVSVGVFIILVSLAELFFGNAARFIDFSSGGVVNMMGIYITDYRLMILLISLLALGSFFAYLKYSMTGIRIRALRDSEQLSQVHGLDTGMMKLRLYLLSGIFAGMASCLASLDVGINPHLGIPMFINAFVALVIGGIGRFDGVVAGAFLLGLIQSTTEFFFDSRWVMMTTFIILFLFLIIRPQGLMAEKSRSF